ncbi:MAG TPA: DUF3298 domain-containing protein [Pyrinomonadaceae bacterium]|nr:DUF3298 domain-containing protein [Pyrinomonadaceae bacterium]
MSRSSVYLLAVLLVFGGSGCKKSVTPPPTAVPLAANSDQAQGGTTTAGETRYFRGSIGSTLGLQMKLLREGEKLNGNYFYQKVGTRIDLRGTIDNDGNVTLEEFDTGGKQTGIFKGRWTTDEFGLIQLAGNWSKPNSDKQTAFSLHEEPISFSTAVEIVAKRIKEDNKKLRYEIDAEYPQLTGSTNPNFEKFNQNARNLVMKKVSDFRKEMQPEEATAPAEEADAEPTPETTGSDLGIGYTVSLANDDLISIEFSVGSYYSGAAHPNSHTEVLNFDLKNGKVIRLSDLFNPGAKYLQAIANYSIEDLKKQSKGKDAFLDDDWIQRGAGADAENYKSWTISRKGLAINFDSYQVGPYAAGPQQVFIPYTALKDLIKVDGPLHPFLG